MNENRKSVVTPVDVLAEKLRAVHGCIIDMDGVLYRGEMVLPHVRDFLTVLDQRALPYIMVTNNSTRSPEQYAEKLAHMQITVSPDRILTSGLATRDWLRDRFPEGTRVYVLGMAALEEAIFGDGYFTRGGADAEVVVSGADFELTYEKLRVATLAIRRGAAYVATNADTTFPSEEGLIPGSGAIVAALVAATGVEPVVVGKPQTEMLEVAADRIGSRADHTALIGDRLDTDILAGKRAGCVTVLVLTGVTAESDLAISEIIPDVVVPNLAPLADFFRRA